MKVATMRECCPAFTHLPPLPTSNVVCLTLPRSSTMADRLDPVRYGGMPRDFRNYDLPTYGDVARCFYKTLDVEKKLVAQVNLVKDQLENSWQNCCPALPLLCDKSLQKKLSRFCEKVKRVNYSNPSAQLVTEMEHLTDKLFDISACSCDLPQVACDHNRVHCRQANCVEDHFICECALDKRVPREDYGEEEGRMVERRFRS